MKRIIVLVKSFEKTIYRLINTKKIAEDDFEDLKKDLAQDPKKGPLITGTGGLRKIRLSSISRGKSGGFRVCYFYDQKRETLFLLLIYPKNDQENLTALEKKTLKKLINAIEE